MIKVVDLLYEHMRPLLVFGCEIESGRVHLLATPYPWLFLPIKSEGGVVVMGFHTVYKYIVNCYSKTLVAGQIN